MDFLENQLKNAKNLLVSKDEDLNQDVKNGIDRFFQFIENLAFTILILLLVLALGAELWGLVSPYASVSSVPAIIFFSLCAIAFAVNIGLVIKRYVGARRLVGLWLMGEFIFLISKTAISGEMPMESPPPVAQQETVQTPINTEPVVIGMKKKEGAVSLNPKVLNQQGISVGKPTANVSWTVGQPRKSYRPVIQMILKKIAEF